MKIFLIKSALTLLTVILYTTATNIIEFQDEVAVQEVTQQQTCTVGEEPVSVVVNTFNSYLTSVIGGQGNLFFSPLSISVTLAMAYLGAGGTTAKAMKDSLGYAQIERNETEIAVHQHFHDIIHSLENETDEYRMLVANGIFIQQGYNIEPDFASKLKSFYSAKFKNVDFTGDSKGAAETINEWVSNITHDKIKDIVSDSIDPLTRLALVNGIYFKGFWKYPFNERLTWNMTFFTNRSDGTIKTLPFMHQKEKLHYFLDEELNYSFLELDYKGEHIGMLIALPESYYEFPLLEMTPALLCKIRSNLQLMDVQAIIPKFKLEYERELSEDLTALGLGELFSEERANFSCMTGNNDLHVSSVIHKAVVEVNEIGTEASAATGMYFSARSGYNVYPTFLADHPFLFYIIDKRTQTVLFTGRLTDP